MPVPVLVVLVISYFHGSAGANCDTVDFNITIATTPVFCEKDNGTIYASGQISNDLLFSVDTLLFGQDTFFTGLETGTHVLYMRHSSGCIDSIEFLIDEIPPLEVAISTMPEHCGQRDGVLAISPAGGRAPYVYRLNSMIVPVMPEYAGNAAGEVIVSVTDDMGCESKDTVIIEEFPAPLINGVVILPAKCDTSDGSIEAVAQSQGSTLMYALDGGGFQAGTVFDGLAPGGYTLTVTDTFGCTSDTVVNVTALDGPSITGLITTSAHCGQSDGYVEFGVEGGSGLVSFYLNDSFIGYQTRIDGLPTGTYELKAVDTAGCESSQLFVLDDIPGVLITDVSVGYSSCDSVAGAYVDVDVRAFGDVRYSADSINFQVDPQLEGLGVGELTIYAVDEFGCEDSRAIIISNQNPRIIRVDALSSECNKNDGEIWAVYYASLGPYYVSVDGDQYVEGPVLRDLPAGQYTFFVRNEMGCQLTYPVEIEGPPQRSPGIVSVMPATCGKTDASINIEGMPAIVSYSIDGKVDPAGSFDNLYAGDHLLEYTDTSGCERDTLISIPELSCDIYLANIFSPNGDGVNDHFGPALESQQVEVLSFTIADRWGGIRYQCAGDCAWDGRSEGLEVASGVYVYMLRYRDKLGNESILTGNVTLVR